MSQSQDEPVASVPYDESFVNVIRGKSLMMSNQEIGRDIRTLCRMVDWFEERLDEVDEQDMLGTEGWRHYFRLE